MEFKTLHNLAPGEYEHPLDKKALDALQTTRGIDTVVRKFHEHGIEKIFTIQITGSNIQVTPESFPGLFDIFEKVCEVMYLTMKPEVYIYRSDDQLQGFTTGMEHPIVSLSNGSVECFSEEEMMFIIGREIGHIKSKHILYYEIGAVLPLLSDVFSGVTLGLSSLISMGLQIALMNWKRMAEYTADRAGLLACQNVDAATSALTKIAGLPATHYGTFNPNHFAKQARQFKGFDTGNYNKAIKYISLMFGEQQWVIDRAKELYKWVDSGDYQRVVDRKTEFKYMVPKTLVCYNCGSKISENDISCDGCGILL
ncbi:MAG: M48 family metallopeptidase [Saprospiraceae bacterium]|nr:M48 family metallopeptidase [Saprospiraceae bacterium]MCB9326354.1 M48 family metallopeptidase [Lewinellaceae bacterium]